MRPAHSPTSFYSVVLSKRHLTERTYRTQVRAVSVYYSRFSMCFHVALAVSVMSCNVSRLSNAPVKWEDGKGGSVVVKPNAAVKEKFPDGAINESSNATPTAAEAGHDSSDSIQKSAVSKEGESADESIAVPVAAVTTLPTAVAPGTPPVAISTSSVPTFTNPAVDSTGKALPTAKSEDELKIDAAIARGTNKSQLVKIKLSRLEGIRNELRACRSENAVSKSELQTETSKAARAAQDMCQTKLEEAKTANLQLVKDEAKKYVAGIEKELEEFSSISAIVYGKCRVLKKDGSREVWVLKGACLDLVGKLVDNSGRISGIVDATNQEARSAFGILSMTCYAGHAHLRLDSATCQAREKGRPAPFAGTPSGSKENVDTPKSPTVTPPGEKVK